MHDCTKYLELTSQLHLCAKYGIELDALEQKAVKLLHSKTGACMARYVFGEPDEVYEAIFWHTTGKADMALLDKILYMADYIEPNRDFEGVERLRKLAYTDLDQAMLLGVKSTIREMEERGVPVHINTIQARQWLLDRGVKLEGIRRDGKKNPVRRTGGTGGGGIGSGWQGWTGGRSFATGCFQTLVILSVLVIGVWLGLKMWMKLPEIPDPSGGTGTTQGREPNF